MKPLLTPLLCLTLALPPAPMAAVDIRASYTHTSNSFLGGLFSNSSTTERRNTTINANALNAKTNITVDAGQNLTSVGGTMVAGGDVTLVAGETVTLAGAVSTNYTSTESNNNSGFFITDTTEVLLTQSADFTSITAGGEVEVSGAQVVANLDQSSAAIGLNAKSLIGIDEAGSAQRLEISGIGPANAPSSGGSGGAGDPAYDFAGSTITIGLPTSLDDAGYAYLDALNASGQLTVQEMALIQHQFYDQDIQLGTLGQLLLQYVTAGMTSGLTGIQAAMARAAISGGLEGALTGNFDVAAILTDVVFAGVSSYATSSFNLNEIMGVADGPSLLGVANGQFSVANITNSLGDSLISAGLTTAVYGGDFGDAFLSSFSNSFVNLAQADLQTLIGDRYNGANAPVNGGEGSIGHVLEHAFVGCITGAALGGSCEASAVAAGVSAVYAGAADPKKALENKAQFIANVELLGGIGAALASGGDTNATMIASGVAVSAFTNNYLNHAEATLLEQDKRELQACLISGTCSADELTNLQNSIAYLQNLDATRDADLEKACSANPNSRHCIALTTDALVSIEYLFTSPSGPFPSELGPGYADLTERLRISDAQTPSLAAMQAVYGHRLDTIALLSRYMPSVETAYDYAVTSAAIGSAVEIIGLGAGRINRAQLRDFWADERGAVGFGKAGASTEKTYQTYTKTNIETGEVYCGRTSGCAAPRENVIKRDQTHHMNDQGFGPAQ